MKRKQFSPLLIFISIFILILNSSSIFAENPELSLINPDSTLIKNNIRFEKFKDSIINSDQYKNRTLCPTDRLPKQVEYTYKWSGGCYELRTDYYEFRYYNKTNYFNVFDGWHIINDTSFVMEFINNCNESMIWDSIQTLTLQTSGGSTGSGAFLINIRIVYDDTTYVFKKEIRDEFEDFQVPNEITHQYMMNKYFENQFEKTKFEDHFYLYDKLNSRIAFKTLLHSLNINQSEILDKILDRQNDIEWRDFLLKNSFLEYPEIGELFCKRVFQEKLFNEIIIDFDIRNLKWICASNVEMMKLLEIYN